MKNLLKRRLKAGEQVYGTWVTLESPIASEMMSSLGLLQSVYLRSRRPGIVVEQCGLWRSG